MPEDLEHFLEPEKAQQAFEVLDGDGDGQVTLHNIRDAVVNIYQVSLVTAAALPHVKNDSVFQWCPNSSGPTQMTTKLISGADCEMDVSTSRKRISKSHL